MVIKRYKFVLILFIFLSQWLFAQEYPLRLVISNKTSLSPNIIDFKENPSKFINVSVINTNPDAKPKNIYLELLIQQISPTQDVIVRSNKYIRPIYGISIKSNAVTKISDSDLFTNFATHSFTDFTFTGISFGGLSDINNIIDVLKLPEGTYRLCLIAYDYDSPLGEDPVVLSDPNSSCSIVRICYKANSPKWLEPVSCLNDLDCYDKEIVPTRMIRFSWTPISNSCGVNLGVVDYTVKLFSIWEGQTADEAVHSNSPIYLWEKINNTSLMIDTFSLQNIFIQGGKFAIQVMVNPDNLPNINEKLQLENDGVSKVVSFIYGKSPISDYEEPNYEKKEKDSLHQTQKAINEIDRKLRLVLTEVDCGVPLPANQIPIQSLMPKDEVLIDKFPMIINEIRRDTATKLFKGKGIIRKPIDREFHYFDWVNVLVEFDSLAVNTNKQVFGGYAKALYSASMKQDYKDFFRKFNSINDWAEQYCGIGKDKDKAQIIKNANKFVSQFTNNESETLQMYNMEYRTLPIKLRKNVDGNNIDVAISDMKFTPTGATFSMIYFMKVPEINQVLPFGLKDVCMNGSPVQDGHFCLISDAEIPLGSNDIKLVLRGGDPSSLDRSKTYVKWDNSGFNGVHLNGFLHFSESSGISSTDENKQNLEIEFSTDLFSWDDWIVDLSIGDFKVAGMPDYEFKAKNAIFDHSTKRNHNSYSKAVKTLSPYNSHTIDSDEYTGLFISELNCQAKIFTKEEPVQFSINNALLDANGISFAVEAKDLLSIDVVDKCDWQLSIDRIMLVVIENSLREGTISGQMTLPLCENTATIRYSSVLSYSASGKIEPKLSIEPISYKFLNYFNAELDATSYIVMKPYNDSYIVRANLNGKLSTRNNPLKLNDVSFQNMHISNWNESENKRDFVFNLGSWTANNATIDTLSSEKAILGGFQGNMRSLRLSSEEYNINDAINKGKTINLTLPMTINLGFGDLTMASGKAENIFSFGIIYDSTYCSKVKLNSYSHKLSEINVKGEFGMVSLDGSLDYFDNSDIYGIGARGKVNCSFPMGIKAEADVIFGEKSYSLNKRSQYFCAASSEKIGERMEIPLSEPLVINAFNLAIWKNMDFINDYSNSLGFSLTPSVIEKDIWGLKGQILAGLSEDHGGMNILCISAEISGHTNKSALTKIDINGRMAALGYFPYDKVDNINESLDKISKTLEYAEVSSRYRVNCNLNAVYYPNTLHFYTKTECDTDFLFGKSSTVLEVLADGKSKKWFWSLGNSSNYDN